MCEHKRNQTHIIRKLSRSIVWLFAPFFALVVFAASASASCNMGAKSLALSSAPYAYPVVGGGSGVMVTYTVNYTVNSTAPNPCTTPRIITITPIISGGTLAAPTCVISLPITVGASHLETANCPILWTEPVNPNASYTISAGADASGVIFDIATSNTLTFNRQPLTLTLANTTNSSEPSSNGTLTVTQSAISSSDTIVALSYAGTATNTTDYTRPTSITIPAGQTTATITLAIVDDALAEGQETVDVTLANVTSGLATLGAITTATNTIADDDAITVSLANTTNGSEPTNSGILTATQSGTSTTATIVALSYAGTATNTADYTRPTSITIPAGQTTATITLAIVDDAIAEGQETVDVTLANVTSGLATLGTTTTATNTIADDDAATLAIATTRNGAEPSRHGTLSITQSIASSSDTVVQLAYAGTAKSNVDYTRPIAVTIPAGQTKVTISIQIKDDSEVEGIETVEVSLASVSSGLASLSNVVSAIVTIADNDKNDGAVIAAAFEKQTQNFVTRRSRLITSHEPTRYRLINRVKGDFQGGTNEFNVIGLDGTTSGQFALNSSALPKSQRISPVADLPERQAKFNFWTEGQFAFYNDKSNSTEEKGDMFIGYVGIDLKVHNNMLIGLMGEFDWTRERARATTNRVEGTGWMLGPYVSAEIFQNIFFDARAMWGQSNNTAVQSVLGSQYNGDFTTNRWLIDARLSGQYEVEQFTFTPEASLLYMRESQNDFTVNNGTTSVAVNGEIVDIGTLSSGLKIEYLAKFDDISVRPFIGGRLLWNFENPALIADGGIKSNDDSLMGEVKAGFNITSGQNEFSFEGAYTGLGDGDLEVFSLKAMFLHAF